MKRFILSFTAAVALFATSCVQPDVDSTQTVGSETLVSLSVETSAANTRTIADGEKATTLQYAVYDADWNYIYTAETVTLENLKANLELSLLTGTTYNFAFWADANKGYYTPDFPNKKVAVSYDGAKANDESRDAFYGILKVEVKGTTKASVTLKRPFAQVNFGANDLERAGKLNFNTTNYTTDLKVSTYETLNFVDGSVEDAVTVTFAATAPQSETTTLTAGGKDYAWVAMNYVLCPAADSSLSECTMVATDGTKTFKVEYPMAPVKRNWRTNLVGSLFTDSTKIEVEVTPGTDGDETNSGYYINNGVYYVQNATGLKAVADLVNAGDTFKGKVIELDGDIDLSALTRTGYEWTPIGNDNNHFQGTIEGHGHTISGLKVTERHGSNRAALVGTVSGTVAFRNFTIKNAEVRCPDFTNDFYGAALIGTMYGHVTIDGVNVEDSYISGNNKVAALVAHDGVCSSLSINNCHISGVTFEALYTVDGGSVGGLVGFFQGVAKSSQAAPYGEHYISNSTVKNCVFNVVNSTNSGKRANGLLIGGISSKAGQELYINNCIAANNTWNEKYYVTDNTGTTTEITSNTFASPYGGLIGGDRNDDPKGKVYIDGEEVYFTQDVFNEAVTTEGAIVTVQAGEFTIPSTIANGVTIVGTEGAVLNVAGNAISADNVTIKGLHIKNNGKADRALSVSGKNPVIEDCVFTGAAGNGTGIVVVGNGDADNVITLKNCDFSQDDFFKSVFDGWSGLKGSTLVIDGCTLANGLYAMHIDGNKQGGTIIVKNSTIAGFVTNGASLDLVSFENCTFGEANGYACANIFTHHSFVNCTFPTKADANNVNNYGLYVSSNAAGENLTINGCKMSDGTALDMSNIAVANGGFLHWDSDTEAMNVTINGELFVKSYEVTPSNIASTNFTKNGIYKMVGDFSAVSTLAITPTEGVDVVVDAKEATLPAHFVVKVPGLLADNDNDVMRSNGRKGNYTFTNFNTEVLSLGVYGTSVAVTNSTLEYLDFWGGNVAVSINDNTIDGKGVKHERIDGQMHNYGVYIALMNYDLKFDNNTITNTVSHAVGINGLTSTFKKYAEYNAYNEVVSFTGNKLLNLGAQSDERVGFKV